MRFSKMLRHTLFAATTACVVAVPAYAQDNKAGASGDEEIIVTARKRDETLISVPVVVTAVSGETLAQRGIINLDGLAQIVPQLIIGDQGGSLQGGNISIRGISGPDQNPFGDSAVSFNVDSVQVSKASVRRMSDFDTAQIEVLKGPQALFFGKNSPAGIISIRTADPTKSFSAGIKAGYEFEAKEIRTEAFVSGPLSDSLGFRLAGVYNDKKGDLNDVTPDNSRYKNESHNQKSKDWALRGTLKWEPSSTFDAKLKFSYGQLENNGVQAATTYVSCPDGVRQNGSGIDQCHAGGRNVNAGYGTIVATIPAQQNFYRADGANFLKQKQMLGGLEMNYHPSDHLTVTSVTGYYSVKMKECANFENDTGIILPSCGQVNNSEFSQELRMSSDYDGPLNFTGCLYYSKTKGTSGAFTYLFAGQGGLDSLYGGAYGILVDPSVVVPGLNFGAIPGSGFAAGTYQNPLLLNNYLLKQKGTAYSAYLQIQFKPIEQIEIDVGGRYSKEKKRLPLVRSGGGVQDFSAPKFFLDESTEIANGFLKSRKGSWNDFSPEATISYRPNQNMTVFGSYKHGFLSGGFNSGSVTFTVPNFDLSYNPQTIKGFEAGLKLQTLNNALRFNMAVYSYQVKDLQVSNVFNSTNTISNAGSVKIKGIEADFNYRTPLEGLSIYGAAAYNKGKYSSYPNAPCYGGQTAATGCIGGVQNLGGTELIRAPKTNLSGGFTYETLLGTSMKMGLAGGFNRTSSYLTDASSAPNGRQPAYTLWDASARVGAEDDTWEVSLIGRNLANKHYFVASSLVPFSFSTQGNLSDRFATLSRGREIAVRLSYRFGGK